MSKNNIGAIILGAGKGTRMESDLPKVMMPVNGKPMIRHIINTLEAMNVKDIVTIISTDGQMVKDETAPYFFYHVTYTSILLTRIILKLSYIPRQKLFY